LASVHPHLLKAGVASQPISSVSFAQGKLNQCCKRLRGCCGKARKRAAVTGTERRQVIDIPPVRALTTEHQLLTLLCGCGRETKAQAPDGVTAPVQYGPRIVGTGIYLWHGQLCATRRCCFRMGVRVRHLPAVAAVG
jgi:hypothetical protein